MMHIYFIPVVYNTVPIKLLEGIDGRFQQAFRTGGDFWKWGGGAFTLPETGWKWVTGKQHARIS